MNEVDLSKALALVAIDVAAGEARARYITISPGQEATYILKDQHANQFRGQGWTGPVPSMVQAEMTATGSSARDAAQLILDQSAQWVVKGAQIETARRAGKHAIAAAADVEAVEAAQAAALQVLEGC